MRNVVAIIVFFLLQNLGAFAAKGRIAYPGGKFYIYRLSLTDKKGSPGTLDHPEKYLSQKALLRRERQHISVDSLDLPLSAVYLNGLRSEGAQVIGGSKWNNTVLVRTKDTTIMARLRTLPYVKSSIRVFKAPESTTVMLPDDSDKEALGQKASGDL